MDMRAELQHTILIGVSSARSMGEVAPPICRYLQADEIAALRAMLIAPASILGSEMTSICRFPPVVDLRSMRTRRAVFFRNGAFFSHRGPH